VLLWVVVAMLSDEELEAVYAEAANANRVYGAPLNEVLANIRLGAIAGLRAVEAAVRADTQREVRTVEYRRVMPDGRPRLGATFEQVPELDEGWTAEFRELGPWHAVTPSTPNQTGAEQ
jgi:hypothetical protein